MRMNSLPHVLQRYIFTFLSWREYIYMCERYKLSLAFERFMAHAIPRLCDVLTQDYEPVSIMELICDHSEIKLAHLNITCRLEWYDTAVILHRRGLVPTSDTLREAIESGIIKVVEFINTLLDRDDLINYILEIVPKSQSIRETMVEYFVGQGYTIRDASRVVIAGSVKIARLFPHRVFTPPDTITAVKCCHLELLQYVYAQINMIDPTALIIAIQYGYTELVRYLVSVIQINAYHLELCARYGYVRVMRILLHKFGYHIPAKVVTLACTYDAVELVQLLVQRGCSMSVLALDRAARHGNFEVVKYLFSVHAPYRSDLMAAACRQSNVDIVKFLYDRGVPWCYHAMNLACRFGHYEVMVYAHLHNAPYNRDSINQACRFSHKHIVEYLLSMGLTPTKYIRQFPFGIQLA